MLKWIKSLFKSFHFCRDNVPIRLLNGQIVAGYLHSCPTCGKTTELGVDAQMKGEKFGNFYSIRQSIKAHKRVNESSAAYKIMVMRKGRMKFKRSGEGFVFYEVGQSIRMSAEESEYKFTPIV